MLVESTYALYPVPCHAVPCRARVYEKS